MLDLFTELDGYSASLDWRCDVKQAIYKWQCIDVTLKQLAEMKGVSRTRMGQLIKSYGVEGAIEYCPKTSAADRKRNYMLDGYCYTITELCEMAKLTLRALTQMKRHGLTKKYFGKNDDI
jgi:hypothetical protein